MSLQTVFITNRNINSANSARTKKKPLFGDQFNLKDPIRMASAQAVDKTTVKRKKRQPRGFRKIHTTIKSYELTLVDIGDEASTLQSIVNQPDNGKPWIFFLHGNNQTLDSNLQKSRQIQQQYDANMIIFSWPSFSYNPKLSSFLLPGVPLTFIPSTRLVGKWLLKKAAQRQIKQYRKAQKAAVRSVDAFIAAFTLLRESLLKPLSERTNPPHTSFLVHSLGNGLLQNVVEKSPDSLSDYTFNSAMLHQADVQQQPLEWISNIQMVANENTTITRNVPDYVLFLSGLVNNDFDISQACTRLGNRKDDDIKPLPFNYIDFTGLDGVNFAHSIAWESIAWEEGVSDEVERLCKPVLTGLS